MINMFKNILLILGILFLSSDVYAQTLPVCASATCTGSVVTECKTTANVPCVSFYEILPEQIAPGQTLGGVTSTATAPTQAELPSAADVESGIVTGSATGTIKVPPASSVLNTDTVKEVTGTVINRSAAWNYNQGFPGAGKYSAGIQNTYNVNSATILTGNTILGVDGTHVFVPTIDTVNINTGGAGILPSGMYRDKGTALINYEDEASINSNATTGYRVRPIIDKDTHGSITNPNVTPAQRASVECGTLASQTTIAAKIADCLSKNPTTATWDGTVNGNAAEGVWKLVLRMSTGEEVWQDQRTKLVWSDKVTATNVNWCKAVGSNDVNDSSNYCNNNSYQPSLAPESYCEEILGFTVPAITVPAKGGLSLNSTPAVKWRLPTANDVHIAGVNGFHLVLPNMSGINFWSASVNASYTNDAWLFSGSSGLVGSFYFRNSGYAARCVGVAP